jgi:hypothetical protein
MMVQGSSMTAHVPLTDPDPIVDLVIEVRPGHRPRRWEWWLLDRRDGSVFEHSLDYDSPSAARRAGIGRLMELAPATCDAGADTPPAEERATRYLVIVSRRATGLYNRLRSLFTRSGSVEVVLDRRQSPRSAAEASSQAAGWWIARASDRPREAEPLRKSA